MPVDAPVTRASLGEFMAAGFPVGPRPQTPRGSGYARWATDWGVGRGSVGRGGLQQLLDGAPQQAGDVHLRVAEPPPDLRTA